MADAAAGKARRLCRRDRRHDHGARHVPHRLRPCRPRHGEISSSSIRPSIARPRSTFCSAIPARRGKALGWEPEIDLDEMIREMVDADLERLRRERPDPSRKGAAMAAFERILLTGGAGFVGAPSRAALGRGLSAGATRSLLLRPGERRRPCGLRAPSSAIFVDEAAIDARSSRIASRSRRASRRTGVDRAGAARRRSDLAGEFSRRFRARRGDRPPLPRERFCSSPPPPPPMAQAFATAS